MIEDRSVFLPSFYHRFIRLNFFFILFLLFSRSSFFVERKRISTIDDPRLDNDEHRNCTEQEM